MYDGGVCQTCSDRKIAEDQEHSRKQAAKRAVKKARDRAKVDALNADERGLIASFLASPTSPASQLLFGVAEPYKRTPGKRLGPWARAKARHHESGEFVGSLELEFNGRSVGYDNIFRVLGWDTGVRSSFTTHFEGGHGRGDAPSSTSLSQCLLWLDVDGRWLLVANPKSAELKGVAITYSRHLGTSRTLGSLWEPGERHTWTGFNRQDVAEFLLGSATER